MKTASISTAPGKSATVNLMRGDVLQLFSKGTNISQQWAGSKVTATHPIQVITGSGCANVPDATTACDHLEEIVLPAETLGQTYAVTVPRTRWRMSRRGPGAARSTIAPARKLSPTAR